MVMAESSPHDVELKIQSVGVSSSSDAPATTTEDNTIAGDAEEGTEVQENGIFTQSQSSRGEDQLFEDGAARSDTDTSRAGSVAGDSKSTDIKPVKKFAASKPVSFAKYSVPKVVASSVLAKPITEKITNATSNPTLTQPLGRPRLVAKTSSSAQQKTAPFKAAAPDPMQVWNKNRITPQQSTKHLTDEELKQQYGIHLTSRLQSDGEGKEAKWADIDDDEDDWAPETIEWNDGTKTTVNPADAVTTKAVAPVKASATDTPKSGTNTPKIVAPQYSSSVGPNATVLKVGAKIGQQQTQHAGSQQLKGTSDKTPSLTSKTGPAPTPAKSPWAKLPTIEKVSPIVINPQPSDLPQTSRLPPLGVQGVGQNTQAPSPAKEMSADDFNRSWRDSSSGQTRELFMPSSGRYEAVSDGRRRMSKNDQSFRAPAVLQRPNVNDTRGPAEPSPAFQTRRTSIDQGRRRASSSISGTSGQFARRMSFKSNDVNSLPVESQRGPQTDTTATPVASQDESAPQVQSSTYQARGGEYPAVVPVTTDVDIEAQRAAQKALMKENIERARKRKLEEAAQQEAERQERIRAKLASLPPVPAPQEKAEETTKENLPESAPVMQASAKNTIVQSPPKPPQPLATGEPQQYGMMKVHPMDSVKKLSPSISQPVEPVKPVPVENQNISTPPQDTTDKKPSPPILTNGARPSNDPHRASTDSTANPEPSPKFNRPVVSMGPDARSGWANVRNDHRTPQASNLWGLPHKTALGNGTFDQSLAGYSPQDLSRTSSTGQGWMNGRTPTMGQSPQLHHVTHQVPETRSHLLQSMTSPDQQPLTLNSEVDSVLPISRPAPIGPPPTHGAQPNGNGVAAWNNFPNVARVQERAESDRINREIMERRDEEKRTGIRQQAPYSFNETFKQIQLGEQVGQRHITNVSQPSIPPNSIFGAVGSTPTNEYPTRMVNGQGGRGSRFFPPQINGVPPQERRAVTYSHPELPRTPSPPPAEEIASYHPAYDGNFQHPVVHFPREKAVVRLPPAEPLAPPTPPAAIQDVLPAAPAPPLTWAARVSMPAPTPLPQPQRVVSQPIVQTASWQERFNGLLGRKELRQQLQSDAMQPVPTEASSKMPLDVAPPQVIASVSLPLTTTILDLNIADEIASKDVEDEEDLFEDREAGSLPIINFPRDTFDISLPRPSVPRLHQHPVDATTVHMFMVNNWNERHTPHKPQYAIIRAPGTSGKGIRKDLPAKGTENTPPLRPRNTPGYYTSKFPRNSNTKTGIKPRSNTKTQQGAS